MGLGQVLFGGLNASLNPADYAKNTQYQDRDAIQGAINQGLGMANNRQAQQLDQRQSDYWRNMQQQQAGQLQKIASGQQQGAGELAVQRQIQNALAAQQAQARMARGGNAALAYRDAAQQQAGVGLQGAGQAQQAALQDQQAAQGALANLTGQARGQDLGAAQQNLDSWLRTQGLNDAQRQAMLGAYGQMDATQLQAALAAMGAATSQQGMLGGLLNTAGQLGAAYFGSGS